MRFFSSLWLASEIYNEMSALRKKRRGFLHVDTRPTATVQTIRSLEFEILPHPHIIRA